MLLTKFWWKNGWLPLKVSCANSACIITKRDRPDELIKLIYFFKERTKKKIRRTKRTQDLHIIRPVTLSVRFIDISKCTHRKVRSVKRTQSIQYYLTVVLTLWWQLWSSGPRGPAEHLPNLSRRWERRRRWRGSSRIGSSRNRRTRPRAGSEFWSLCQGFGASSLKQKLNLWWWPQVRISSELFLSTFAYSANRRFGTSWRQKNGRISSLDSPKRPKRR